MSGLGEAWVRTNVRKAKELLVEYEGNLTKEERDYLDRIVSDGELFLKLVREYNERNN
ncbi:MAG: hypothetical protein ABSD41_00050 [Candidatus Bathyarchaeia archaeon]|jgi:hypothetical protein